MDKKVTEAIIVSGVWPMGDTGAGIAVKAALRQFAKVFSKIHFFGPGEDEFLERDAWIGMDISWLSLPLTRPPKWVQFLKSLSSAHPAVVMRFRPAVNLFHAELDRIVRSARQRNCGLAIIYENLQASYLLQGVKRKYPEIPQAVHSLDPYVKGFENLDREGPLLKRLAWWIELRKMRWFETGVFRQSNAFWTITQDDLIMYRQRLGIEPDGVLGVYVDADRYASVPSGAPNIVVHVGSADLRKGKGLHDFVLNVWPLVRAEIPEARLVVGGRDTERLTNPGLGVEGLGFVQDDCDVFAKGAIFVNPQRTGAGIKLKSVVAMLAGKALVSTSVGIEGVEGKNGEHFFVEDEPAVLGRQIIALMRDPQKARSVGVAARILATESYSEAHLTECVQPLLARFLERRQR